VIIAFIVLTFGAVLLVADAKASHQAIVRVALAGLIATLTAVMWAAEHGYL
jgi:hypothetical protein